MNQYKIIFIIFLELSTIADIFSQCEAGNYQIKEYVPGDTCWIMYAYLLAMDNCSRLELFRFLVQPNF